MELDAFLGVERTGWSYLAETPDSPQPPPSTLTDVLMEDDPEAQAQASLGEGVAKRKRKRTNREAESLASVSVLRWGEEEPVPANVTSW